MFRPSPTYKLLRVLVKQDAPLTLNQLEQLTGFSETQLVPLLLKLGERGWVAHLVEPKRSGEPGIEECWKLSSRGHRRVHEVLEPAPLLSRWFRALRRV